MLLPALSSAIIIITISTISSATEYASHLVPPPLTVAALGDTVEVRMADERRQVSERRVFKRQAGRGNIGGCGNMQLGMIMQRVVSPLLSRNQTKIGDIARIVQQTVQRATGKSFEIFMGRGDMVTASHQMEAGTSCRMRIGDYYTTVYETPVQYDITNAAQEQFLSNIDFGEPLGGSGYPGQEAFPHLVGPPSGESGGSSSGGSGGSSAGGSGGAPGSGADAGGSSGGSSSGGPGGSSAASNAGRARLGGCGNAQLGAVMNRVAGPLLSQGRLKMGDIAKRLQTSVQQMTGKSYEIMMGKGMMVSSSYQMDDMTSCRMRVGEYYTTVYETPVQYDITNLAEEQFMSNIDFGEKLGGSGYPGQQSFPRLSEPPASQPGHARLGGCGNAQLAMIMNDVAGPMLMAPQGSRMRIGDIAQRLQQAVQQATGQSYEVFMSRADMITASYGSESMSCSQRIGDYYTRVYESPVQHNIFDAAEEQFMSNIDFGQELGGSGFPGQQPFLPENWYYPQQYVPPQYYPPAYIPPVAPMECFSGDALVDTIEGPKRMRDLKTGDEVLSIEESMISFSPIIMFLHRDEEILAEFNVIKTNNGRSIKLTNEHLIYVSDCDPTSKLRLVRAKDVTTKDCLMTARSPVKSFSISRVVNVTKTYERGIYAPLTSTGDLIANGILSSCHSNLGIKTLQQSLFNAYRLFSYLIPKEGGLPFGLASLSAALDLFIPTKGF